MMRPHLPALMLIASVTAAPLAVADPDVRSNLVRPIYGPGPTRSIDPPPQRPSIATPRPVVVQGPSVRVYTPPPQSHTNSAQPQSRYRRGGGGGGGGFTSFGGYTNSGGSTNAGGYAGGLARPAFRYPSADSNRLFTASHADLSLSYARSSEPWWRGEGYTARPNWNSGEGPRYVGEGLWTRPDLDPWGGRGPLDPIGVDNYGVPYPPGLSGVTPRGRIVGPGGIYQYQEHQGQPYEPEAESRFRYRRFSERAGDVNSDSSLEARRRWTEDTTPARSGTLAPRPRSDVRPDIRRAVRLTLDGRYPDAVQTLRTAVAAEPEAFTARHGDLFAADPELASQLSTALSLYNAPPQGTVAEVDARFMTAALRAAQGEHAPALEAISTGRTLGEDAASGQALHRVLTR